MKKPIRITLFVLAAITIIVVIAAIIMLKAVFGDNLFYMDSTLGSIYAVSYRWVCLAGGMLILFWILLLVKKRSKITDKLFCSKCGKQISAESKFCTFCGLSIVSSSNGNEAEL